MFINKDQWKKWTVPSKASYLGLILAIVIPLTSYITLKVESKLEEYSLSNIEIIDKEFVYNFKNEKLDGKTRAIDKVYIPQIDVLINNQFLSFINEGIEENLKNTFKENLLQYQLSYEKGLVSPQIVSIKISQYSFYWPALNGNNSVFAINFSPKKKRIYTFFDLFDPERDALNKIKSLIKEKTECDFFNSFDNSSFIPRFYIKEKGVEFIFSEYEVSPGMCGSFEVFLTYYELTDYINRKGPLSSALPLGDTWDADFHSFKATDALINEIKKYKEGNR